MAGERGYEQQVGARAQDVGVQVSPDAFGAGLGRAIGELGNTLHQQDLREYQIQRQAKADSELTEATRRIAEGKAAFVDDVQAARVQAPADGTGHSDAVMALWDKRAGTITEGITDQRVLRQVQSQIQSYRGAIGEREAVWEVGQSVSNTIANADKTSTIMLSQIARDPASWPEQVKSYGDYVGALAAVDEGGKRKMRDTFEQQAAIIALKNMDPVAALATLRTPLFDFIAPEARMSIERDREADVAKTAALEAQQISQQKALLTEEVQTLKELERQGVEVSPERLAQARKSAAAMGDTSTALELDGIEASNRYTKVYQAMTPIQREQRMAALAGKAKPTAEDQRELAYAQSHVGPMNDRWNSDPIGNALATGLGFSAIDLGDPASIAKRVQDHAAFQRTSGRRGLPLLSKTEAQPLMEQAQSGAAGRIEVLSLLDRVPARERDLVAKQIMKGDKGFAHEAQLRPEVRATVFQGRKRLETDRTFLTPEKGDVGAQARSLLAIAGREQDAALREVDTGDLAAIKQTAGEYLVGMLTAKGRSINSITPNDIRIATLHALGGAERNGRQYGGLSHWGTGDMDRAYVLPDNMSALDFRVATERLWVKDKPPMPLRSVYPVMIAPGTYRWETRAGNILRVNGQDYITRIGGLRE